MYVQLLNFIQEYYHLKITTPYNFRLSDENNGSIPLNGLNMNITLLFYKKDNINELIRNFLKMIVLKDKKEE